MSKWNKEWIDYRGPVTVVADDMQVFRGEAFDTQVYGDMVAMGVRRESDGEEIYFHPRDVYPICREEMA
jgi:hypothetical protein